MPHPRAAARRALRRRLAQASARIEKGSDYQRSLAQLAELAAALQEGLSPAQRSCWLTLEEAVLEHTARLNRAYFHAGAEAAATDGRISSWLGHRCSAGQPSAMSPAAMSPSAMSPAAMSPYPPAPPAAPPPVNALPLDAVTLDSVTLEAVAMQAMTLHAMAADSVAADARLLAALTELIARLRRLSR